MNLQIKKNKLDLEYNKNTQILNAVFILSKTRGQRHMACYDMSCGLWFLSMLQIPRANYVRIPLVIDERNLDILTTGILGFIGSFIFLEDKNKLTTGLVISAIIILIGYGFYKKINKKLDSILKEVENL